MSQSPRRKIAAGNWKMNTTYQEGRDLTLEIVEELQPSENLVILAPPFLQLKHLSTLIGDISNMEMAAQNCHFEDSGAFTGEVSAPMLRSVGVKYVILGHSERRTYFGEDNALLSKKVDACLRHQLRPIFCCGEKLEEREAGKQEETVRDQIQGALFHLEPKALDSIVIAYEPVWAIGTGKTASPEQAQEMHAFIRMLLKEKYGEEIAEQTSILYGGSVKPGNAADLFRQPDVDGGLVGGASLKAKDFIEIIQAFPTA